MPKVPIFAESETMFFPKVVDAEIEFFKNEKGQVTHLVLHQGGRDTKALRKQSAGQHATVDLPLVSGTSERMIGNPEVVVRVPSVGITSGLPSHDRNG
jgi:hypothetical protein